MTNTFRTASDVLSISPRSLQSDKISDTKRLASGQRHVPFKKTWDVSPHFAKQNPVLPGIAVGESTIATSPAGVVESFTVVLGFPSAIGHCSYRLWLKRLSSRNGSAAAPSFQEPHAPQCELSSLANPTPVPLPANAECCRRSPELHEARVRKPTWLFFHSLPHVVSQHSVQSVSLHNPCPVVDNPLQELLRPNGRLRLSLFVPTRVSGEDINSRPCLQIETNNSHASVSPRRLGTLLGPFF